MTTINMNDRVTVRLTETGLRMLDEYEANLGLPERHRRMSVTDGNLWKGQLWALMQEFGPSISMGFDSPFLLNLLDVESCSVPVVTRSEPGGYAEPTRKRVGCGFPEEGC